MIDIFISTLKQTVIIIFFVLLMMIVIEYINVQSKSTWANKLQKTPFLQIVIAALLGITPGCLGAFTVVSLYTHRLMGLAGLVTVMIATSGDEAFVMFALFPGKALILHGVLLIIAIATGWIIHLFTRKHVPVSSYGFVVHPHESCHCYNKDSIVPQLKKLSFERSVLLIFTVLFLVLLGIGVVGPVEWDWKKITFMLGGVFLLFLFATVPDHFLKEHLYDHILKKHLLRLFLWTWGAFIALYFIQTNLMLNDLLQNSTYLILVIAVLMGIIPESGPHLVFVTLFSQNLLPFSILLANSIVQDGHGMLPLLAESRRDFILVKGINMLVGLLVGLVFLQFGL
ncbi:MAG TPA: putative manganese transporter [Bacteroidales bacterium]|nr:putative manganese transporter [Bacteroidales bacterium]HNS45601.1 putative manganese transporter [Bacteroidales bacterium]